MAFRNAVKVATLLCCFAAVTSLGNAQDANAANTPAVVMFDFSWDASAPVHYAIAVQNDGSAMYRSDDPPEKNGATSEPYVAKFTVTDPVRSRIFSLAAETNLFKGDFDFTRTRVAKTGVKTLTYVSGHLPDSLDRTVQRQPNQATYNWSQNMAIQELTRIFQGISSSFELGRTLDFKRRFDKLSLDSELKQAEEMQKRGDLEQLQVIFPVLKNIANDVNVMHIARERAKRILSAAELPRQEKVAQ